MASHFTLSILVLHWVISASKTEHVRYCKQATVGASFLAAVGLVGLSL